MVDRLLLWLGAGVIAGGVTVGMLAGAGTADAQTESDGDGGAKTSQSAKPADNEQDSSRTDTSAAPGAKPRFGRDAVKAINAVKGALDDAVTKVVKAVGDSERATVAESNVRTTSKTRTGPTRREAGQQRRRRGHAPARPQGRDRQDAADRSGRNGRHRRRGRNRVDERRHTRAAEQARGRPASTLSISWPRSRRQRSNLTLATADARRNHRSPPPRRPRLMCRRWSAPSAPPSSA